MIREHALLSVEPDLADAFAAALQDALPIIRAARGCLGAEVTRCLEEPGLYLLLVDWEHLEDHDPGFRQSPSYAEWKALLHRFYDSFPTVRHFTALAGD